MSSVPSLGFYEQPARQVPVIAEVDVLVVGGGPGGIGAAVSAARNGAKTIILERFGSFGGTWTSGILSAIMPYPFVRGIFAEVIAGWQSHNAWKDGGWGGWEGYGNGGTYDSEVAKIVLDRLVVESGAVPYFFTQVVDVIREGDRVKGVVIESKEGRQVILAKMIIDSSGDGDVCVRAGVPSDQGRESDAGVQPMTMIFKMTGIDNDAADGYQKIDVGFARAWRRAKTLGEITVPREDVLAFKNPKEGEWSFNTTRVVGKDGTKVRDVTDAMIEGRRQVAEIVAFVRKYIPGFANAVLSETASHIGVRETRRIRCDYTMVARDIIEVPAVADCIARGNWFIDIHSPTGEGTERIHPPEGKWYEIPYRSICAQGVENLLVASRCIDCSHEAHAAVRVTPQVMAIGEGAGTAAALCVKNGLTSTRALDVGLLRETLRSRGAFV